MPTSEPVRILYIEDDFGTARLLQKHLNLAGYVVDVAHDGVEGLAMWTEGSYDLLATDHDVPGMTGLELIRTLASRGPLPPTIVITGMGNETIAVEAMKLGADDYIIKDAEAGYLVIVPLRVGQALERRRLLRERTAELSRTNERLIQEIAHRERSERMLRELTEALRLRVKELDCLYGISSLLANPDLASDEVFERIVDRIPRGWSDSETVSARIVVGDREFAGAGHQDCLSRRAVDIVAAGEKLGSVEVGFREEADDRNGGTFLEEETRLLREIADRLSTVVQNRKMRQAVRESEHTLATILELVPVGISLVENRRLLWVNRAYREMLGFEKEEDFAGKDTRFLYYSEDEYESAGELYQKLRDGNAHELDLLLRRTNGSPFAGRLTMKAFDPSNPLKRVVCSLMPLYRRA